MFGNIPPSERKLIPDFPILSHTNVTELNRAEILCIVLT